MYTYLSHTRIQKKSHIVFRTNGQVCLYSLEKKAGCAYI